jgi:hypothetical protein
MHDYDIVSSQICSGNVGNPNSGYCA